MVVGGRSAGHHRRILTREAQRILGRAAGDEPRLGPAHLHQEPDAIRDRVLRLGCRLGAMRRPREAALQVLARWTSALDFRAPLGRAALQRHALVIPPYIAWAHFFRIGGRRASGTPDSGDVPATREPCGALAPTRPSRLSPCPIRNRRFASKAQAGHLLACGASSQELGPCPACTWNLPVFGGGGHERRIL